MKLYLVRKNLATYIGPYSLDKIKKYAGSIHCAQQDEISRSCGKWVKVSDSKRLRKYYPELVGIFSQNNELLDRSIVTERPRKKSQKNKASPLFKWAFFACFLAVAGVLATKIAPKIIQKKRLAEISMYTNSFNNKSRVDFVGEFKNKLPEILELSNTNQSLFLKWLPLLRVYAFSTEGSIKGISNKELHGRELPLLAQDCSLERWKQEWTAALPVLKDWIDGKIFVDSDWARLLYWDIDWLQKQSSSGWINPKNAFDGCIQMAQKSFLNLKSNTASAEIVERRLSNMVKAVSGQNVTLKTLRPTTLDYLTCLEFAEDLTSLSKCKTTVSVTDSQLRGVLEYRFYLKRAGVLVREKLKVDYETYNAVQDMNDIAPLYLFDYKKDLQVSKSYFQSGPEVLQRKNTDNEPANP